MAIAYDSAGELNVISWSHLKSLQRPYQLHPDAGSAKTDPEAVAGDDVLDEDPGSVRMLADSGPD
jgi:hypothetical protein